jgi:hypothetical protein
MAAIESNVGTPPGWLEVSHPGFGNIQVVPTANIDATWRTDGPGVLRGTMETEYITTMGLKVWGWTSSLFGKWVWWEHPTAGGWGGVITAVSCDGPFTYVTAEQWPVLLRKRRISSTWRAVPSSPGSLALTFLNHAARAGEDLGVTDWVAEEGGETIDYEPRGGDLCDDIFPELASYGYQWRVTSDDKHVRQLQFRERVGQDKRTRITLSEGVHIPAGGYTLEGDLWTVTNSIEGVNADELFNDATGYVLEDQASIRALGRRYETTIGYNGMATSSTIAPLVQRDLERYKWPAHVLSLDVLDADLCWSWVREGDTIMVHLPSANLIAPFQVDIRTLIVDESRLQLAGSLVIQEVPT